MSTTAGPPAAEARPLRADAKRNQQRLLSAAVEVFAERGADSASLEEIARRAGVGIGTLYRHFPTRQALLEAVYQDQIEALRARADDLLKLTHGISYAADHTPGDDGLAARMLGMVIDGLRTEPS